MVDTCTTRGAEEPVLEQMTLARHTPALREEPAFERVIL
jgi:hypothetical protein